MIAQWSWFIVGGLIRIAVSLTGLTICAYLWRCAVLDHRDLMALKQNGINEVILKGQIRTMKALTLVGAGFLAIAILSAFVPDRLVRMTVGSVIVLVTNLAWWLIAFWALKDRRSITMQVRDYDQRQGERRDGDRRQADRRQHGESC